MKGSKIILPIVLVLVLAFSWFTSLSGSLKDMGQYSSFIREAENSVENGLYEQAIEFYKESLQIKNREDTYFKIKETYEMFYKEEHTAFVRNCFIEDMELAASDYPECAEFWTTAVKLYLDALNYSSAYKTVQRALNYGAASEELEELNKHLLYMVKEDYKLYYDFKTALNGYISVFDGNKWCVLNGKGEEITSDYQMIGLINDDGKGFYKNDIDARFLDSNEVTRARFEFDLEDAGYYTESAGYAPVKLDIGWKYVDLEGEFLPGTYDYAGSFYAHKAAVQKDGEWMIINDDGKIISEKTYEDIKLDLYGSYVQCGIVIAKENGKYHLYNEKFEKIGNFECDDIDICIDGNLIAFSKAGKWGFVDIDGKIIVEPQYAKAKSFSNKMAAVRNSSGRWGYINKNYELVIGYQYLDAFYFNSDETSVISNAENAYQILHFMFE